MKRKYEIINDANHDFKSNNFYVYELINPSTRLPFYVGKGRDDRAWRHISLRNNAKIKKANPHKTNTINQIITNGGIVPIKIVSTHEHEDIAFNTEKILIELYGRAVDGTGILTNLLAGGEGYTHEGRPVDQFTMWGEYVQTHKNAKEATRANGWKNYSGISACCTGRDRSYKGYLWAYSGQEPTLLSTAKPVYQWSLNGEFVDVYRNASVAARQIGCDPSIITDCARGDVKQASGFIWTNTKIQPTPVVPYEARLKAVKHLNTDITYASVTLAARATSHSIGDVSACCNGRKQKIGNDYFCYATN